MYYSYSLFSRTPYTEKDKHNAVFINDTSFLNRTVWGVPEILFISTLKKQNPDLQIFPGRLFSGFEIHITLSSITCLNTEEQYDKFYGGDAFADKLLKSVCFDNKIKEDVNHALFAGYPPSLNHSSIELEKIINDAITRSTAVLNYIDTNATAEEFITELNKLSGNKIKSPEYNHTYEIATNDDKVILAVKDINITLESISQHISKYEDSIAGVIAYDNNNLFISHDIVKNFDLLVKILQDGHEAKYDILPYGLRLNIEHLKLIKPSGILQYL